MKKRLQTWGISLHKPQGKVFLRSILSLVLLSYVHLVHGQIVISGGTAGVGTYSGAGAFNAAINALNSGGAFTGPVQVNIPAGSSYTLTGKATLTVSGTSANPLVIAKSGAGINPIITAYVGAVSSAPALTADGMFVLSGTDYLTLDGIDFQENSANTTVITQMEYGIALAKASAGDGAQYNTITNCKVSLNRLNGASWTAPGHNGSVGIGIFNSLSTTHAALTPLTAGGSNSNNTISNNIVEQCHSPIVLAGFAATTGVGAFPTASSFLGDLNNSVTGNTIVNFGGGNTTNPSSGIFVASQWGAICSDNTIDNNNGGGSNHASTLRGINFNASATSANLTCNSNTVTIRGGGSTQQVIGIDMSGGTTAAGNTIQCNNNILTNCSYNTATSGTLDLIYINTSAANVICNGNNVNNSSQTGSGAFEAIYILSTPTTVTCNNNIISSLTKNGSASLFGIRVATTQLTCSGNQVFNLTNNSTGTSASNIYAIYDLSSPTLETITNNTVYNCNILGTSTSTSHALRGIYFLTSTSSTKDISGNTIYDLTINTSGSGTCEGINSGSGNNVTISKNKIYNITSNGASSAASLLTLTSGTTQNINNNILGFAIAPTSASTSTVAVNGINITGGTTCNLYHNTVYLAATTSGATQNSNALSVATSQTTTNLINNVFVNVSTPPAAGLACAYRRSSTTLTSYTTSNSNGNLFYAGVPGAQNVIFTDGTNIDISLSDFKTRVTPRDGISATEMPPFLGLGGATPFFLHIDTGVPTQTESGGTALPSISTDFDGDMRNTTTPDMGADEFAGISVDLAPPIISFSPLAFTCATTDRTLVATISDASGVPSMGGGEPTLYWKVGAGSYNAVPGVSLSPNTFEFTFGGGVSIGDVISYYIVAQDNSGNVGCLPSLGAAGFNINPPTVATPPSAPLTYNISNSLNGSYNVGAGGTFATLTAAVAAYNTSCLLGPVEFVLTNNLYSTAETFPITITANPDASAVNTLTIRPATTATITGAVNAGSIIKLFGADHVIINGSNSGTTRDLTIQNLTSTTSGNAVIWINAASVGNGSSNNVVKNCIIEGNSHTTSFTGIHIGGSASTIGLVTAGVERNDNQLINNNLFKKTNYGVTTFGYSATQPDQGIVVSNNNFGTPTDNLFIAGVWSDRSFGLQIYNNEIQNLACSTGFSGNMFGLRLLDFKNGIAYNNNIHNIENTLSTSTPKIYGIGISSSSYTTAINPSNALVYNNMISRITSIGSSSVWNVTGILAGVGFGDKYYHNTVHLTGPVSAGAAGLSCAFGAPDGNISGNALNLDVRNNIFNMAAQSTATSGTPAFFTIYSTQPNFIGSTLNYNNLNCNVTSSTGATPVSNIGRLSSGALLTLANWQTASSQDLNSISITPTFVSNTDPHILLVAGNLAVSDLGTPLASVSTDIDADVRSTTTPDIGADEFTILSCSGTPLAGTSLVAASTCLNKIITLSNSGATAGLGISTQWMQSTTAGGPYTPISGATAATYTFTATAIGTTYYVYEVTCNSSLVSLSNEVSNTINALPAVAANSTTTSFCFNNPALTLTATGATTYSWLPVAAVSSSVGSSVTSAPTATTVFTVTGTDANTCTATSTVQVTYNGISPSIQTISASPNPVCAGGTANLSATAVNTNTYVMTSIPSAPIAVPVGSATATFFLSGFTSTTTDDGATAPIPLPFNFAFFGNGYNAINIHTNGYATFSTGQPFGSPYVETMPNAATPNNYIALLHEDLNVTGGGVVSYFTTGTAPNRIFVIDYKDVKHYNTSSNNGDVDAQIHLHEGSNSISLHLLNSVDPVTSSKNIGIENAAGTLAYFPATRNNVSFDITTPESYLFTPNGVAGLTYSWTPIANLGSTNNSANAVSVGLTATQTYTVTVSNSGVCPVTSVVTIAVNNLPTVTATVAPSTISIGGSATITASGATTYTTMPGALVGASQTVSPTSNAIYTVTGTDANGCTSTSSAAITVIAASITAVGNQGCNNTANASIEVMDSTGLTSPISFSCSDSSGPAGNQITSGVFDALFAGTYTISANDGSITVTTVVVIANPAPVAATYTVISNPSCFGYNDGALALSATGGTISTTYIFDWYNTLATYPLGSVYFGDTNTAVSVADANTYTIVVSDDLGCTASISGITMTQPAALGSKSTVTNCGTYTWSVDSTNYSVSGVYYSTSVSAGGCPVADTLDLTIVPITGTSTSAIACNSYLWASNGTTYTTTGIYYNTAACNTDTLDLSIRNSIYTTDGVTACNSYTWLANTTTYSVSGTYTNSTANGSTGCSDTATLVLTINNPTTIVTTITQCNGSYLWPIDSNTYTASGSYGTTLYNPATTCNDNFNLTLTINTSNNSSTTTSACDSFMWPSNGNLYTSSGTYQNITTGGTGCADTASLVLTINNSSSSTDSVTACNSYTWPLNGTTYYTAGTYTHVGTNANGCAHITTLVLSINASINNTVTTSSCDSFTWATNATTYTNSGMFTNVVVNTSTGCNDTTTLALTINSSYVVNLNVSAPFSYALPWGNTVTTSGTYSNMYQSSNACDSLVSIAVTINGVRLMAKAILSGPYTANTGLMNDNLRTALIPTTEPYGSMNTTLNPYSPVFTHVGGGGETVSSSVLSATGNNAIVDWVFVQLRSASNPAIVLATRSALIQRDGDIVDIDGASAVEFATVSNGNYFVSVQHRNHLGIMTAGTYPLSTIPSSVDLSAVILYLRAAPQNNPAPFTGAARTIGSVKAMYAGNCNISDGARKRILTYNAASSSDRAALLSACPGTSVINGYSVFDCNMNGSAVFNGLNPDRLQILINCGNNTSAIGYEQLP
jgi:trimeric autotransporter adhesin